MNNYYKNFKLIIYINFFFNFVLNEWRELDSLISVSKVQFRRRASTVPN